MGMRTYWAAQKTGGGYASGGTSSYPVTGFPQTAYLGNNRRVGGGNQSQPSPISGGLGTAMNFDPRTSLITLVVIIVIGYTLWHLDNR